MTVRELIGRLLDIPETLLDKEVIVYSTDHGERFSIRKDVSQFNISKGTLQIYAEEAE